MGFYFRKVVAPLARKWAESADESSAIGTVPVLYTVTEKMTRAIVSRSTRKSLPRLAAGRESDRITRRHDPSAK